MSAELKEVLARQQSRGERGGPGTGDRALWKRGEGLSGARAGGTAAPGPLVTSGSHCPVSGQSDREGRDPP